MITIPGQRKGLLPWLRRIIVGDLEAKRGLKSPNEVRTLSTDIEAAEKAIKALGRFPLPDQGLTSMENYHRMLNWLHQGDIAAMVTGLSYGMRKVEPTSSVISTQITNILSKGWEPILSINVSQCETLWAAWSDDVRGALVFGHSLAEVLGKFSVAKGRTP